MRLLLAEDEKELANALEAVFKHNHYSLDVVYNGADAYDWASSQEYDGIILDIMMPKMSGLEVLEALRKDGSIVPILLLTAKSEVDDKVLGLDLGADDYLAKPFNPLEAVARVNSNIRRFYSLGTKVVQEGYLSVRDLVLNQDACTLKKGDKIIQLTSVEYRIMELLMKHPGKVFTKQQIYEHGWGEDYIVADNNIMVCISKLRAKLDDNPSAYIQTIRGLGYRLEK